MIEVITRTTCDRCAETHQEPGARRNDLPPVSWAVLDLAQRGDGPGWSVPSDLSLRNKVLCPACADDITKAVRPRARQPRRCECGEVARYRYSWGPAEHLTCSDCPVPHGGWDGPWHLCDTCGDDCDPRDGFRCPACRAQVGAPEEDA